MRAMCEKGRMVIFLYFICLESLVNARPQVNQLNSSLDFTGSPKFKKASSERTITSVRILTKPNNVNRRGVLPTNLHTLASTNQAIVFPDSYEDDTVVITPLKSNENPPCAKGMTFCEKVEGYPGDLVERLLMVPSPLNSLFGIDDRPDEIANRLGDETEISLCQSVEKLIFPKYGKTKNNKWKYIINQKEKHVQGVRVETCSNPGDSCSLLSNETLGYTSVCKQKFVNRRLISISEEGHPTTDIFEMPSACCCSYRKLSLETLSFE